MSMDRQEQNAFDSAIRDGDWNMSMGETRAGGHYYEDAKDHYFRAKENYEKAYNIARYADDHNGQSQAENKINEADSAYRSVSSKEWEYTQSQKDEYEH